MSLEDIVGSGFSREDSFVANSFGAKAPSYNNTPDINGLN